MTYTRSRKFCCCLPVRFGVFCESLLGLLLGGLAAIAGWIEISQMMKGALDLTHSQTIALWCVAVSMTIFTLVSLLGLIGSLGRMRALVGLYAGMITFVTILDVAAGIFLFYNLFVNADEQIQKCQDSVQGGGDDVTRWECNASFKTGRVIVVVVYVIFWLIQIYGCWIAFEYVSQLKEEEENAIRDSEKGPGQNVTIVSQPQYAFTGEPNRYGTPF